MAHNESCFSTQIIDGRSNFNVAALDGFIRATEFDRCGVSYGLVSIIGPQGSGKSTLMNCMYGTNFLEMDASKGRSQTTKGIWIARPAGIEPCILVMDVEGTDGRDRGSDDIAFEKQSALFSLAISDIILINMWYHDIGREQAAGKPLLRTVFEVMLKLFDQRKTNLMFVIHDAETELETFEPMVQDDMQKIWDAIPKPQTHQNTPLSEFFNVMVVALPHYTYLRDKYEQEVEKLKERIQDFIAPRGVTADRDGIIPASGFSVSVKGMWELIKYRKDLHLPAHRVMVATVRCDEIISKELISFNSNEVQQQLKEIVESEPLSNFGRSVSTMLDGYLSRYDNETKYFDEGVRSSKRKLLIEKILQVVHPFFKIVSKSILTMNLERFKSMLNAMLKEGSPFAQTAHNCKMSFLSGLEQIFEDVKIDQSNWAYSEERDEFQRQIDAYITKVRSDKLSQLETVYQGKLKEALSKDVTEAFDRANINTWSDIRRHIQEKTKITKDQFSGELSNFEMNEETRDAILSRLDGHAKKTVEEMARAAATRSHVLRRMKERFSTSFNFDSKSHAREWSIGDDVDGIAKIARGESLKALSVMAAICLDNDNDFEIICNTLDNVFLGTGGKSVSTDTLDRSYWPTQVLTSMLTPVQCKAIWLQFTTKSQGHIHEAQNTINLKKSERDRRIMEIAKLVAMAAVNFSTIFIQKSPCFPTLPIPTASAQVPKWASSGITEMLSRPEVLETIRTIVSKQVFKWGTEKNKGF